MHKKAAGFLLMSIFLLVIKTGFHSCKHEPITQEDPPDTLLLPCHPDTIYFEKDLLPLLVSTCARSGCHDAQTQQDGVRLTDYESVIQTADVRPGQPEESDLYEVLVETDEDDRMPPPPDNPLAQSQIQMVYDWIDQGALNLLCQEDCDTLNVTFSGTVFPIIEQYCINCHSGANPSGGISLSSYTEVAAVAGSGLLEGVINHEPGFVPMPLGGAKLPECNIRQIMIWIQEETPDN